MHANKKNSNGVHFRGFFLTRHDYLQVKLHFGFQKRGRIQSCSKTTSGWVHATGQPTFALSGQQNLLESKSENDLLIHIQVCAAVPLNAIIISADL